MPSECRGEYLTLKGGQKLDQRQGGRGVVRKKSPLLPCGRDMVSYKTAHLREGQIVKGLINQNEDLGSLSTLSRGVT